MSYYSGSIDYTSANLWLKLYEANKSGVRDKGFIERDLATGRAHVSCAAASRGRSSTSRRSAPAG